VNRAFAALGRFSVRFRWLVLAGWLVGTLACGQLLPSLSSVVQNDNTDFLPAAAPSMVAAQLAAPLENSRQVQIPVVVAGADGGALTAPEQAAISTLRTRLAAVAGVASVQDTGVSADGRAYLLRVMTASANGMGQNQVTTLVNALSSVLARAGLPPGLQAHLSGPAADNAANDSKGGRTGTDVQLYSTLLIIVLLFLIFRSLLAPLVTLLPPVLVVTAAGPLIAEAANHGLQVSQLAQLMLIVLVLGAGTDYGLFLIFRVREEARGGLAPRAAIVRAVERVGESIAFSAGTVVAALLSLLAATFGIYSNLGVPLAIGIGLMLLAGLTLLPALLAIFGRAVFWPARLAPAEQHPRFAKPGLWGRIAGRIVERPALTLTVGLLAFGALAIAAFAYQPAGFGGTTTPPAGSDAAAGDALVAQHFPKTSSTPTQIVFRLRGPVWTDPAVLAAAQQELQGFATFAAVTGPLTPNGGSLTTAEFTALHRELGAPQSLPAVPPPGTDVPARVYQTYRATAQYVSAQGTTVIYDVNLAAGPSSSTAAMQAVPAVRADAAQAAQHIGATGNGVVGQAAGLYDVSSTSDGDLKTVVPIAILVIGVLLALVMRSLISPLYLITSVALSYLAALGLSVLLFTKIGDAQGLTFILPFLLFLFLMALGEDYNILVMTRIREEAHHLPLRRAVTKAVGATGTTVTSAGLILAGTFGVFALVGARNGSTQLEDVGAGLAIGILMDTFLVRTLLVPSTVVLLGRWNWWPSRLTDRPEEPAPARAPGSPEPSVEQRVPGA
jgi:RND superfamily putative drug exporter